jgi:hypothetical protein
MDNLFSTASSFLKGSQETHSSSHDKEQQKQQQHQQHQGGEGEEEIKEGYEQKQQGGGGGHGHSSDTPSYGEVFSSAQVLIGAAMGGSGGSGSRAEVAEAAGNILGAVSHYAHLEQTSYGSYVEKAETYLHQYGSKHASATGEENPNPGHRQAHQGREDDSETPSRENESGQYGDESGPQHKAGGEQGRHSRNEE